MLMSEMYNGVLSKRMFLLNHFNSDNLFIKVCFARMTETGKLVAALLVLAFVTSSQFTEDPSFEKILYPLLRYLPH